MSAGTWKHCSICKTGIEFGSVYYRCSVSTCRSKRTGFYFCSVACFEAHVPMMRHRDAWAEEETAPTKAQAEAEEQRERQAAAERVQQASAAKHTSEQQRTSDERRTASSSGQAPKRRVLDAHTGELQGSDDDCPKDVLVVASKLKKYIKARSGMNTSDGVLPVLSDHLRRLSILALRHAAQDGRKTVLDRDVAAVIARLDL